MNREQVQRTALDLSAAERRELVEILWESLERDPEPLPAEQRRQLDERLAALEKRPERGSTWAEVEERIWTSDE